MTAIVAVLFGATGDVKLTSVMPTGAAVGACVGAWVAAGLAVVGWVAAGLVVAGAVVAALVVAGVVVAAAVVAVPVVVGEGFAVVSPVAVVLAVVEALPVSGSEPHAESKKTSARDNKAAVNRFIVQTPLFLFEFCTKLNDFAEDGDGY